MMYGTMYGANMLAVNPASRLFPKVNSIKEKIGYVFDGIPKIHKKTLWTPRERCEELSEFHSAGYCC